MSNLIPFPSKTPADGDAVRTYGVVTDLEYRTTTNGNAWAIFALTGRPADGADLHVLVFPQVFDAYGERLVEGATVEVVGRYTTRDSSPSLYLAGLTRTGMTA